MGKVPSAVTVSSIAYLTDTGRAYLFGTDALGQPIRFNVDGSDNLKVTQFAVFDGDKNYRTTGIFSTGEMPDVSGAGDDSCLKTAADLQNLNFVIYQGSVPQNYVEEKEISAPDVTIDAYTSY